MSFHRSVTLSEGHKAELDERSFTHVVVGTGDCGTPIFIRLEWDPEIAPFAPSYRMRELDRRARAANTRADKLQKENTILRDRLGIAPHHVVLPRNVYFSAHDARFYDMETRRDMGDDFLLEWGERWPLFPVNPNAPSMADLVDALQRAQKDPDMTYIKIIEATINQSRYDEGMHHLWIEVNGKDGVLQEFASKNFTIVGRGGRKALGVEVLVPGTQVNVESDDGLLIQVLGMSGASLLDEDKFVAVQASTAANLGAMKGQIERVQFNLSGLSLLQEIRDALEDESRGAEWISSIIFKIERGSAHAEGKAAAPLLLTVVKRMLPEIIERTIAYAEDGNREAMAEIARIAAALED